MVLPYIHGEGIHGINNICRFFFSSVNLYFIFNIYENTLSLHIIYIQNYNVNIFVAPKTIIDNNLLNTDSDNSLIFD